MGTDQDDLAAAWRTSLLVQAGARLDAGDWETTDCSCFCRTSNRAITMVMKSGLSTEPRSGMIYP